MLARTGSPIGSDQKAARATTLRRLIFSTLVVATMGAMLWLLAANLAPGGYSLLDGLILVCFAITLPWTVIGFWNAAIGFVIM